MDISAWADAAANCSGLVSTRSFLRSERVWGDAPQISAVTLPFLCWNSKTQIWIQIIIERRDQKKISKRKHSKTAERLIRHLMVTFSTDNGLNSGQDRKTAIKKLVSLIEHPHSVILVEWFYISISNIQCSTTVKFNKRITKIEKILLHKNSKNPLEHTKNVQTSSKQFRNPHCLTAISYNTHVKLIRI